jgi:hypothetical protein
MYISGVCLLIVSFWFLLIEFFRFTSVSTKAGELADLRTKLSELDADTYNRTKEEIITRRSSNKQWSELMEENVSIMAL